MKKLFVLLVIFTTSNAFSSEAIGFYSRGKLKNALYIDDYKDSHMAKLFRKRGQNFGTQEIFLALSGLARFMKSEYPTLEKMQIGDIAAMRGGKIKRHKSHQNGLDADVVYFRVNEAGQDVDNPEWAEDFVKNGRVTANFHVKRNWEAFKYLVHNHNVGRIFVDGVTKKRLCRYAKEIGEFEQETEVLRRIRPENTVHKHHYHLRLKCPSSNNRCRAQKEPNKGPAC